MVQYYTIEGYAYDADDSCERLLTLHSISRSNEEEGKKPIDYRVCGIDNMKVKTKDIC